MKRTKMMRLGLATLAILILSCRAQADSVGVSLTLTSQTAAPGSMITFDATITNLSSTDTIYLNGDSSVTSSALLTVDDTPFLTNFPFWLDPAEASGPFALLNVLIDPSTPEGTYDLNSFSILGGLDGDTWDILSTTNFSVTVANVTPTPEINTLYLFLIGIFVAFGFNLLKNRQRWRIVLERTLRHASNQTVALTKTLST